MKNFKIFFVIFFALILTLPVFAQSVLKTPQGRIGVYYRPEQYNPVYKTNITNQELEKISKLIKQLEEKDGIDENKTTKNSLMSKDIYKQKNQDATNKSYVNKFALRKNKHYNSDFINKQNIMKADNQVSKQPIDKKNMTTEKKVEKTRLSFKLTDTPKSKNVKTATPKEKADFKNIFHIKQEKSALKSKNDNGLNKQKNLKQNVVQQEKIKEEKIKEEKIKSTKLKEEKQEKEKLKKINTQNGSVEKVSNQKFSMKNVQIFKKINKNEKEKEIKKEKTEYTPFEQLDNSDKKEQEIYVQDYTTKQIVDEITADINAEREQMLSDMRLLWVNAVQKSDTVYFAVMKLSNPNGQEVNKKGFKKILEPIIGAAPIVGQAFVNPALTAGSIIGSNVLGSAMNDSATQRLTKVNDADLVILARAIDELQQTLILSYMEYKNAYREYQLAIKIADNRREEYENMNKNNSPNIILANTFYNEALDNQYKARQNFLMKRVVLEQLVGVEALLEVEKNSATTKPKKEETSPEK